MALQRQLNQEDSEADERPGVKRPDLEVHEIRLDVVTFLGGEVSHNSPSWACTQSGKSEGSSFQPWATKNGT